MKKKSMEDMTEPELKEVMTACGRALDYQLAQFITGKPMFTLLVFNDPKLGQYLSNCERSTMIEALRETANRLAAKDYVPRKDFPEAN